MRNMHLKDVAGLMAWARMLVNNSESYSVDDANAQVRFYRDDDSAYLVVNVFVGEKGVIEYVFLAENEHEKSITARLIFDFLKTVGYNLHDLLIWLQNATYVDTEMGDRIFTCGLEISRECNECV